MRLLLQYQCSGSAGQWVRPALADPESPSSMEFVRELGGAHCE